MSQRITIVMNDDTLKEMRLVQAKLIPLSNKSVSFSSVIDKILRKGLAKSK